jgi:hypothetical protein
VEPTVVTIAGQLTVTASDDPRFKAGDSIGIVVDNSVVVTTSTNVELSAPVAAATAPATTSDVSSTTGDSTSLVVEEAPTLPATA